jgi:HD superfamily phosphohydrolase
MSNHTDDETLGLNIYLSPPLIRSILDPIYGIIRFSKQEMKIIGHDLFQRLHRIRQNGLLYLIFPSASNTRFEHSIGTVHVAESILENILINSYVAYKKEPRAVINPQKAKKNQAINLLELNGNQLKYIFKITRLAALVHDIGHGPLSHIFEFFAPKKDDISQVINNTQKLKPLRNIIDLNKLKSNNGERVKHEIMSCILFAFIWSSMNDDSNIINSVSAAILGENELCMEAEYRPFIPLIHDIVASAPADADRMDYLERDSRSFGVNYGLYDRNRLLKSFLVYKEILNQKEVFRLGIKYSGLRAIENFIQARFQLYIQIYYHKTNRAVHLMIEDIIDKAKDKFDLLFKYNNQDELIKIYRELSDERFLNILRGIDSHWQLQNQYINQLATQLFNRKLWKRVFEAKKVNEVEDVFKKLKQSEPNLCSKLIIDKIDPQATKGLDLGAALLRRGVNGIYEKISGSNWLKESPIIRALANEEKEIARIYLNSDNLQEIEQVKRIGLQLLR